MTKHRTYIHIALRLYLWDGGCHQKESESEGRGEGGEGRGLDVCSTVIIVCVDGGFTYVSAALDRSGMVGPTTPVHSNPLIHRALPISEITAGFAISLYTYPSSSQVNIMR